MSKPIATCLLSLVTLAPLSAQIRIETFDGPALPAGWTVRSGNWSILNGQAIETSGTFSYLTLDGVQLLNCVVEADVYWYGGAIQAGGVAARHAGLATEANVMVKVQSNSAAVQGFDTLWNYERPGSAVAKTAITPLMTKTRIRLLCVGDRGWLHHDSTQDGIYDTVVGPKVYATARNVAGLVGICNTTFVASAPTGIDNFALYDAVLMETGSATPKIGTNYPMTLTTQATRITPFICAAALTNGGTTNGNLGGIPIGGGRFIPLAVDPILNISLAAGGALGFVGITDAAGVGNPTLNIPNLQALVGLGLHIAGVTLGGPFGIDNISNNHYVKIVQ